MASEQPHIAIIDYGYGNLHSARNAFEKVISDTALDKKVLITDKPEDILSAERVVLPGQGAFGSCINGLRSHKNLLEALTEAVFEKGRPFLGICVGMQLLASRGNEFELNTGLDWVPGEVVPLEVRDPEFKIPHMGWNRLVFDTPGMQDNRHPVLKSVRPESYFYFVHSFMFKCQNKLHALAYTEYDQPVEAVVGYDNMIGVQFHPEKSHDTGLRLIEDFIHWKP